MYSIGQAKLKTFCPDTREVVTKSCTEVRKSEPVRVNSFSELAKKVAQLQYENRDYVLLLRGQRGDYRNQKKNSSIKPSIFRAQAGNPSSGELMDRFEKLKRAELLLVESYERHKLPRVPEIKKRQILRWSILQHYEIVGTPLLDVTHSLRVAASFASDHSGEEGFVLVLGVPNLSGAITTSSEAELQIIRLASVCPPQAFRPHIQEGYLLGEYPDIAFFEQKQLYQAHEVDFGRRLVAKFVFTKVDLWNDDNFPVIPHAALYPDEHDPLAEIAEEVKEKLK